MANKKIRRARLPHKKREEILADYAAGHSVSQIARTHHVDRSTVRRTVAEAGAQLSKDPRVLTVPESFKQISKTRDLLNSLGALDIDMGQVPDAVAILRDQTGAENVLAETRAATETAKKVLRELHNQVEEGKKEADRQEQENNHRIMQAQQNADREISQVEKAKNERIAKTRQQEQDDMQRAAALARKVEKRRAELQRVTSELNATYGQAARLAQADRLDRYLEDTYREIDTENENLRKIGEELARVLKVKPELEPILRRKAALELELRRLQETRDAAASEIVGLEKEKADRMDELFDLPIVFLGPADRIYRDMLRDGCKLPKIVIQFLQRYPQLLKRYRELAATPTGRDVRSMTFEELLERDSVESVELPSAKIDELDASAKGPTEEKLRATKEKNESNQREK